MPTGLQPPAGIKKDNVNYRLSAKSKCQTCVHFYPMNSCEIVGGNISPEGVCDRWTIKEWDSGKDGDFYKAEYEKTKNIPNKPKGDDTGAGFYIDEFEKGKK